MKPIDYEQHLRFMHLYNAALAAQEQETLARSLRRMSRHNSYTSLPFDRSHPPPVRRADSSGKLERRKSLTRTSSESGYNSNLEHRRQSRSLDRGLTKRSSTVSDSGTYEGYPRVRRVSVVKDLENRPPTPPIIKRKGSSTRSNDSMSPSVRFSTVEDIMSAYGHGDSWSGRYKPRKSIDRESHITAHSMDDFDDRHGRRSSSASRGYDEFDGGRHFSRSHRRESSSSRRASVSSRRASVSSRRSSVASGSRRPSTSSRASYYDGPRMSIINPNGIEGAEIMRRLSTASELKEWERSLIMRRRSSKSSRRGSRSSRRRSTSSRRRSSVGYSSSSASDSSSDSDSESDSDSSSSGSGTLDSDSDSSSSSSSGSDTESDSDNEDSGERKSSKPMNVPSKHGGNGVNAGFDSVDGERTSRNGGMALATDGDRDWRVRESDASSSVCVIL